MTAVQERRLRELRSRMLVRAFDYRQRRHARGVWFRFRRLLTFAKEASALPCEEAERLVAEGYRPEPLGRELEPSRVILFAPGERLAGIVSARALAVRLSAELLSAECVALVPFEAEAGSAAGRAQAGPVTICEAIAGRVILEFDYDRRRRVVQPYCHGVTTTGQETLRAVQIGGETRSGGFGYGKLFAVAKMRNLRLTDRSFVPDDPDYNPDDSAMAEIHCRVER